MKALVVYYSRTGTTKRFGQAVAAALGAPVEELGDRVNRKGLFGWLRCGMEGSSGRLATLNPLKQDPAAYDLVIIGTPVWAGKMSSLTRAYIAQNKDKLKKVAFFCTSGSGDRQAVFAEMQSFAGKAPLAEAGVTDVEVKNGSYQPAAAAFVSKLAA